MAGDEELVAILLGGAWDTGDRAAAARVAERQPELARHSIHTAVAFGDLDEVRRRLAADPAAARAPGGALGWEPILYLAYSRLPQPAVAANAVELATLLLDHGADPNAAFDDGWDNPFKVLTGVIGLGEGVRPPHPCAVDLAGLLVARGADPYDTQALYNDSIVSDDVAWLDFLWDRSAARGDTARWSDAAAKPSLTGGAMATLDYLLGNAVSQNHLARAGWLLAHGADPNGRSAYSKQPHHLVAQLHGFDGLVALLERHGATPVPVDPAFAFRVAALRLDKDEATRLLASRPAFARDPSPLLIAAAQDRTDVLRLLLDLGLPVDLATKKGDRALHAAAGAGALAAIRLLIDAGADIDRRGGPYQATPLGHGVFWKRDAVIDLIAPHSRSVHDLAWGGRAERLRAVLAAEPALVRTLNPRGLPPLFSLPDDEAAAAEVVAVLLAAGADATARNPDGRTADEEARRRGLDAAADAIAAARVNP